MKTVTVLGVDTRVRATVRRWRSVGPATRWISSVVTSVSSWSAVHTSSVLDVSLMYSAQPTVDISPRLNSVSTTVLSPKLILHSVLADVQIKK